MCGIQKHSFCVMLFTVEMEIQSFIKEVQRGVTALAQCGKRSYEENLRGAAINQPAL